MLKYIVLSYGSWCERAFSRQTLRVYLKHSTLKLFISKQQENLVLHDITLYV